MEAGKLLGDERMEEKGERREEEQRELRAGALRDRPSEHSHEPDREQQPERQR